MSSREGVHAFNLCCIRRNNTSYHSEPQIQWLSSLTAPNAAHLEIEIMGVAVRLEQDPQARQRSSDNSKIDDGIVELLKPSTVGTGVIVWVGNPLYQFCLRAPFSHRVLPTGWRSLCRKTIREWM